MKRTFLLMVAAVLALALTLGVRSAVAEDEARPYVGIDLGVAVPTNDNYWAHVHEGASGDPYVGYMFNDNVGFQAQLHFPVHTADDDGRGFDGEDDLTALFGATFGPRLQLPIEDFTPYLTGQGGVFTGLSGRVKNTDGGFSLGGGVDYYITRNIALSGFGRFNYAFISPKPIFLGPPVTGPPIQKPEDQGPDDIQWVTAGIGIKYDFRPPEEAPPPPPAPVAAPPPPAPPVKKKIVLRSVNFDFDKAAIRDDAKPVLDEAISTLQAEGGVAVIVQGHTDSIGQEKYNQGLSERRAKAVQDYLIAGGIDASRITKQGFGETQPVASNDTADGRAQNRRVELHVD
jgi:OOP family OmpA-OmpF porin